MGGREGSGSGWKEEEGWRSAVASGVAGGRSGAEGGELALLSRGGIAGSDASDDPREEAASCAGLGGGSGAGEVS